MPVNSNFDVHGGFAKSPQDLADLLEIMESKPRLSSKLSRSWRGLHLGFLDFETWGLVLWFL